MANIAPFKVVHYNGACAKELDRLITPPYDVISPRQQEAFYEAHELNIIRLVLGKQYPADTDEDNRYTRAASTLRAWLDRGVLVRRDKPGLVIYQMEFDRPDGGRRTIDGIVALVEVDDYGKGKVLPHEKTYKGPKQEQLNLLRACHSHLTPIHALFTDREHRVINVYRVFMQRPPQQQAVEDDGTIHRTWIIEDEAAIQQISEYLRDKSLFIADGHHRYETALAFKREMAGSDTNGDAGYVMMYLTSTSHPGLTILPAHRMVGGDADLNFKRLLERLAPYFQIDRHQFKEADPKAAARELLSHMSDWSERAGNFGLVVHGESGFWLLRLKSFEAVDSLIDAQVPQALRELDVTILREVVIGHGLGLDKDDPEKRIEYSPSVAEVLEKVACGDVNLAFVLNPTRVEQVETAAELGHKLPHKSTYFYPKIASGLVLNVF
ncbi:MAG: DUF1015 domain-containing protein [Desulfomonile sp.]|nr:DUF1015 domain-containing protein [Desulfomonile sp.]